MPEKTPGVGLIVHANETIRYAKQPEGCPEAARLQSHINPWKRLDVDPYTRWHGTSRFAELYALRYGGLSPGGRPCYLGGTVGGDPHGLLALRYLTDLFASGPNLATEGTPETHNGIPTAQELADAYYSHTVWSRILRAHNALTGDPAPPLPPEPVPPPTPPPPPKPPAGLTPAPERVLELLSMALEGIELLPWPLKQWGAKGINAFYYPIKLGLYWCIRLKRELLPNERLPDDFP